MKRKEINQRYQVSMDKLKKFEEAGFFDESKTGQGYCEYHEKDIEKLSDILSLDKIGLDALSIQQYLLLEQQGDATKEKRKAILEKQRNYMMQQIHHHHICLDCLDYLIYELK